MSEKYVTWRGPRDDIVLHMREIVNYEDVCGFERGLDQLLGLMITICKSYNNKKLLLF